MDHSTSIQGCVYFDDRNFIKSKDLQSAKLEAAPIVSGQTSAYEEARKFHSLVRESIIAFLLSNHSLGFLEYLSHHDLLL